MISRKLAKKLNLPLSQLPDHFVLRRSIDARKSPVYRLQIQLDDNDPKNQVNTWSYHPVTDSAKQVHIIGTGPAGYFAALELIRLGMRPVLFDRGKDVQSRRRDLRAIQQDGIVNPNSNYCFGEGGAGTYSDGKLYTRSHKRGNIEGILQKLVLHGAKEDILVDAHPHIGSNKLPKIIANIRNTILDAGGQVLFDHCLVDMVPIQGEGIELRFANQLKTRARAVILATGHSARDVFRILHERRLRLEAKDFALGVRIEHSQELIDQIQYGAKGRVEGLPASPYKLACQVKGAGVYSFCMCPGGLIVPAATAPGELVVNGMSLSRRDSPFANSGLVSEVEIKRLPGDSHPFKGLEFQAEVERQFFENGDGSQKAPAQRLIDFLEDRESSDLPDCSYIPGIYPARFNQLLPKFIEKRIKQAMPKFNRVMKGYLTNEAILVGVESRTSSPVRIPRDSASLMHPQLEGLFPCGEGAGYAGGILSAAMDGERVARAVSEFIMK